MDAVIGTIRFGALIRLDTNTLINSVLSSSDYRSLEQCPPDQLAIQLILDRPEGSCLLRTILSLDAKILLNDINMSILQLSQSPAPVLSPTPTAISIPSASPSTIANARNVSNTNNTNTNGRPSQGMIMVRPHRYRDRGEDYCKRNHALYICFETDRNCSCLRFHKRDQCPTQAAFARNNRIVNRHWFLCAYVAAYNQVCSNGDKCLFFHPADCSKITSDMCNAAQNHITMLRRDATQREMYKLQLQCREFEKTG